MTKIRLKVRQDKNVSPKVKFKQNGVNKWQTNIDKVKVKVKT